MKDLNTTNDFIFLLVCSALVVLFVWLVYNGIQLIRINRHIKKLKKAMTELHTMPLDEWEDKWGEFVQKEYSKCNDPHRVELEENMEFFRKELEELKKGDKQ